MASVNRRRVRRIVAGIHLVMAAIYALIGTNTISVVVADPSQADGETMQTFGLAAAAFFLVLAGVSFMTTHRAAWWMMAAINTFVAYVYFSLSADRVPDFEAWGVTLRILQIPVIVGCVYLALKADHSPEPPDADLSDAESSASESVMPSATSGVRW